MGNTNEDFGPAFDARPSQTVWARARFCAIALIVSGLPSVVAAEDRLGESSDQNAAYRARSQGTVKSLDSVIDAAKAKGKVIDARLRGSRYKLRVLDNDGRVRSVDVDASTSSSGSSGNNSGSSGSSGSNSGSSDSHGGRGGDESSGGRGRGHGR